MSLDFIEETVEEDWISSDDEGHESADNIILIHNLIFNKDDGSVSSASVVEDLDELRQQHFRRRNHGEQTKNLSYMSVDSEGSVTSSSEYSEIEAVDLSVPKEDDQPTMFFGNNKEEEPKKTPAEILKENKFFAQFPVHLQKRLFSKLKRASFKDGDIILKQGEAGDRIGFIISGKCTIWKNRKIEEIDSSGKKIEAFEREHVTNLYPRDYFGEVSVYSKKRTATVAAVGDTEIMFLSSKDMRCNEEIPLYFIVKRIPVLQKLSKNVQIQIVRKLKCVTFKEGTYVMKKGDKANSFYIIMEGKAAVLEDDGETVVAELRKGHFMGQMAMLTDDPRNATIQAKTDLLCYRLKKVDFRQLVGKGAEDLKAYFKVESKTITRIRSLRKTRKSFKDVVFENSYGSIENLSQPSTPISHEHIVKKTKSHVNDWNLKEVLGKGTFGLVKRCVNSKTGAEATMKIVDKRLFEKKQVGKKFKRSLNDLYREINIMKELCHKNIVQLFAFIESPKEDKVFIIMEYCAKRGIFDILEKDKDIVPLSEDKARKYFRDVLQGLEYLHFRNVIHRDIKPMNLFVTAQDVVKIGDFGTACVLDNTAQVDSPEKLVDVDGTPAFMAPELLNSENMPYDGPPVDLWACGATLFMFIVGKPPWESSDVLSLATKVNFDELIFPDTWSTKGFSIHLRHLISSLLQKKPSKRLKLLEAMQHEWVTEENSDPLTIAYCHLPRHCLSPKMSISTSTLKRKLSGGEMFTFDASNDLNPYKRFKRTSSKHGLLANAIKNHSESFFTKARNPLSLSHIKNNSMNTVITSSFVNQMSPRSFSSGCTENGNETRPHDEVFDSFEQAVRVYGSDSKQLLCNDIGKVRATYSPSPSDTSVIFDFYVNTGKSPTFRAIRNKGTEPLGRQSTQVKIPLIGSELPNHSVIYSKFSVKGTRPRQEDRIAIVENFNTESKSASYFFAGVFDGFGGDLVSDYVAKRLPKSIARSKFFESNMEQAIREGVFKTNTRFLKKAARNVLKDRVDENDEFYLKSLLRTRTQVGTEITQLARAGSTAAFVLLQTIEEEPRRQILYYSWLGDSRILLSKKQKGLQLSVDHNCTNEIEAQRIRSVGGTISLNGRLNGSTLVSRGFGALNMVDANSEDMKNHCRVMLERLSPARLRIMEFEQGPLSFEPDVRSLEVTSEDEFVFIATDGVFENLTSVQVIEILRQTISLSKSPDMALERLTKEIRQSDNASMILVLLNQ